MIYVGLPDSDGKTEYMINHDVSGIVSEISSMFPERVKLHHSHPEWLKSNDIHFIQDSTLSVTFLSEGAGYRNALGYYIYDTENPPRKASNVKNIYILMPNCSFPSSGDMKSGDRVNVPYEVTQTINEGLSDSIYELKSRGKKFIQGTPTNYTFPKGKSVGFVIIANGWKGGYVSMYSPRYYSNKDLNPERAEELKYHTAMYVSKSDPTRMLMGFEDLPREKSWCDHDFNDLVVEIIPQSISSISKDCYVDTDDVSGPSEYNVGYKKCFVNVTEDSVNKVAPVVVTLHIPKASIIVHRRKTGKKRTNKVYVRSIIGCRKVISLPNSASKSYAGISYTNCHSRFDKNFTYSVGQYSETTLNTNENISGEGISYFDSKTEAEDYEFDK